MVITDLSQEGPEHYDTFNQTFVHYAYTECSSSPTRWWFQAIDPSATSTVNKLPK